MIARGLICFRSIVPAVVFVAAAVFATSPAESPVYRGTAAVDSGSQPLRAASIGGAEKARIVQNYGSLPLVFEKNEGQTDPQVKYVARTNGYATFLTPSDVVLSFHSSAQSRIGSSRRRELSHQKAQSAKTVCAVVRMHMVGANSNAELAASDKLPGQTNYYIGNDPKKWQSGVSHYGRVTYKNIYPGIDMAFHGQQRQVEFDFIVAPGANPKPIELGLAGEHRLGRDASGNLLLSTSAGDLVLRKPVAYQDGDGHRQIVDATFVVNSKSEVRFALGPYDHSRELVIDPALSYATYLGGGIEDEALAIAVDGSGSAYVAGQTNSLNFPSPGGTVSSLGGFDAFVTKLSPSGSSLVYTTLLGGTGNDVALGIAVNSTGAYVTGNTDSPGFPLLVTIGTRALQDVFVVKLDSTGNPVQRTIIAGTGNDYGNAIAVDSLGNTYIGGVTDSTDFPTKLPLQPASAGLHDGFVAELSADGTALVYSTYLGGSGDDQVSGIALDGANNAYVSGITNSGDFHHTTGAFQTSLAGVQNGFVSEVKADGSALLYSTFLGGSGTDAAHAIAVDSAGEAYVTGSTDSSDFPTLSAAQGTLKGATDVFITKVKADGSGLLFSTYYGGTLDESGTGIALDAFNDVYVTGRTLSGDFPVSGAPLGQIGLSGTSDAFIAELSNTGFVVYSSYLGGTGNENSLGGLTTQPAIGGIAVDSTSNAYFAGATDSADFPVTASAFQNTYATNTDAFVAKVGAAPADFSIAVSPTSVSTTSGQATGTITVTVSSVNAAFGGPVNLSCLGPLPAQAGCNFSTLSVIPKGTPATSSLTISTNGSPGNGTLTPFIFPKSGIFYAMLLPLGGLALVGAGLGRGKAQRVPCLLLFGLVGATFLLSCGGGSSPSPGGGVCSAKPNAPAGLVASSTTTTGTTLNWSAVTAPANCTVSGYAVYQGGASIGTTTNTNFAVTGLSPGTSYSFTVAASDGVGASAQSSAVPVTTGASCTAAPSAPTGLAASSITTTGTSLSWSAATAPSGCNITGYAVYQGGALIGKATNTNFPVTGLSPGTTYKFTVAASDGAGASPQSSAVPVTTGPSCTAAPSAPTGLAASSITTTSTSLNWSAVTAPSGCNITSYAVYQGGTAIGTPTNTNFAVTGLSPGTTYNFTVAASDSFGASAQSSVVHVTTATVNTPPGTYIITVVATDANNPSHQHSVQLKLTVK
jgi:chitodextrinase